MNLVGIAQAYSYHQKCKNRLPPEEIEKNKVFDFHELGIDHDVNDTGVCLKGIYGQLPLCNRVLHARLRGIMWTFEEKADIG